MSARLAIIACLLSAAWGLGAEPSSQGNSDRPDVSTFPAEMQERYQVFATRCSKCHSLDGPLNARLRGDEWKNYIKKMIRRPGSGINQENGRRIFEFLRFYSERREGSAELKAN